jgi:putative ABC transport system permease protein
MELRDTLWLGVKGISERKFRTALTILSVAIGVAAIVALISLVAGSSASITKSLESIGPATIYIVPHAGHIFTGADIALIQSLPNVSTVIPMIESSANLSINGQTETATIIGVDNYSLTKAIGSLNLYEGGPFNDSTLPVALVGYDIAFPTTTQTTPSVLLNEPIYLTQRSGRTITLIPSGILNQYGTSLFVSPDTSIFVSLPEAESLLNTYSYNVVLVQATNTSTANAVDALLTTIYGNSAEILSVQALAATVSSVIGSISLLLGSIAGISLIVAGISILSIMMVSVAERTREIGILKSIGFKKREVLMLFLAEAVVIGFVGGVAGVILGGGGAYLLPAILSHASPSSTASGSPSAVPAGGGGSLGGGRAGGAGGGGAVFVSGGSSAPARSSSSSSGFSLTPQISPSIAIGAILIAIIVSVLSSLYPAWKASTVDPITALRTE